MEELLMLILTSMFGLGFLMCNAMKDLLSNHEEIIAELKKLTKDLK